VASKVSAFGLRAALVCLALSLVVPWPSRAEDARLLSIGIRAGVTGASVLGEEQQETFREYDAVATVGLPWGWYSESGWGLGTRLIASAGVLQETGATGLIGSLVPALAFGSRDGRYAVDIGFGGALLSMHHFGKQNFGGPFQIVATLGVGVPLYERFGFGYRFQHYSDAGLYGSDSRGADFHMLELTYRY
jgi:hypothetical protein